MISTDVQGRVESLNPVAETLIGWTETEGCHKLFRESQQRETRAVARNAVERVQGVVLATESRPAASR